MPAWLKNNALSLVLLGFFAVFLVLQAVFGLEVHNAERMEEGKSALTMAAYLRSGAFVSATFENWESEFLQMGMYVLLTVWLRQKGSAESRPLDPAQEQPRIDPGPKPWPVRRGGIWRKLYSQSLSGVLFVLFALSFFAHLWGSWSRAIDTEEVAPGTSLLAYLGESEFWFESMQNWQSEFLAVFALVVLSIFLRQKDSPESKPVEAPHSQTGD